MLVAEGGQSMLNYSTIQTIIQILRMIFDIVLMWILLYYAIKLVRNNSRTIQIFKGIILVLVIKSVATFFGFRTVAWMADMFVTWGFLAVIIIFQPEIRGLLEKLGKSSVFSRISTLSGNEREQLVDELVTATMQLSSTSTGALITLEQSHSLSDYIKTGTIMNSMVTSELICSIFVTSTPLHDGAVIIQGDRIACASAYFPPTNLELPSRYGARHRAALGISEITDSITIIVSEESGKVSIAEEGKLMPMTEMQLREYLMKLILNEEIDIPFRSSKESVWSRITGAEASALVLEREADLGKGKEGLIAAKEIIKPGSKEEKTEPKRMFKRFKKTPETENTAQLPVVTDSIDALESKKKEAELVDVAEAVQDENQSLDNIEIKQDAEDTLLTQDSNESEPKKKTPRKPKAKKSGGEE